MNLTIRVDVDGLTRDLSVLQQKQIPFATSKALNTLGVDVQVAERAQLRKVFTLRRPEWADRSIKITHFAKKTELHTTIAISPPGGGAGADILGKFESETAKTPYSGRHVAVPVDVKKNKRDIITRGNRPKGFNLHEHGGRIVGDRGTFLVHLADGRELILQSNRASKKAGRNILLYLLTSRVALHPDLHFGDTAQAIIDKMWMQRFDEALNAALATAR